MREISFKVWDKDMQRMSKPLGISALIVQWEDGDIEMPTQFAEAKRDRFVFLQFTGQNDRLGNRIYEGDIIKHGYTRSGQEFAYIHQVFYSNRQSAFYLTGKQTQFNEGAITENTICGKGRIFQVVGNIYQVPDWLHKKF